MLMRTVEERFWEKVDIQREDECWNWLGAKNIQGYGNFSKDGITRQASKIAHELVYGSSEGYWVLHNCDNPACVNPKHLFLGNQHDNMQDAARKGRTVGENSANSKLSNSQVQEIRELWKTGLYKQQQLSELFGVARTTINNVVNYYQWKNVGNVSGALKNERKNSRSKLTDSQVGEIRELWNTGLYMQKQLANKFGVARTTINAVVNYYGRREI